MRTVVLGERPAELEALIANRRATGADLYDEVWEGEYHMAPMANGSHARLQGSFVRPARAACEGSRRHRCHGVQPRSTLDDFRIPDLGVFHRWQSLVWYQTAALVIEIVSPDDESWLKFGFYAAHGVAEVVIVDPRDRSVAWFALEDGEYRPVARSVVLALDVAEFIAAIDWPPADD